MHKQLLVISMAMCALTIASLSSCSNEDSENDQMVEMQDQEADLGPTLVNEMGIEVPVSSMESGHMRVYITEDLESRLSETEKQDGIIPLSDVHSSENIVSEMGIYKIQRTFPYAGKFEERTRKAGLDRWYDVWFDTSYPIEESLQSLKGVSEFEKVEYRPCQTKLYSDEVYPDLGPENVARQNASTPFNDPDFYKQWGMYNDGSNSGTVAGCDVNVVPVWQSITTGNSDVIVAVVDGGVQYDHEDLSSNMWTDPDNDNKSYGYNFVKSGYNINPENHGTHVAGVIAAVNNNGKGVCGLAGGDYANGKQGARIMSCQIFDGDDQASGSTAIKWAADHGAVIAQNSWGYTNITYVPYSDRAAIDYFNTYAGLDANGNQTGPMAGGVVIFSAGNDNKEHGYPAEYDGVIAVGAVGADYVKAYYSNFGDWVDICAPGGDAQKGKNIYSTIAGNSYANMQGTSMACPHISGVAALIISKYGGAGFTRDMLVNRLLNTETDVTSYNPSQNIGGLVNTLAAMSNLSTIAPDPVTEFSATPLKSNYVAVNIKVPADEDDGSAFGVNVYYDKSPITSTSGVPYKSFQFGGLDAGKNYADTLSGLSFDTKYYLRCVSFDIAGNRSDLSKEISVVTSKNNPPVITVNDNLTFDVRAHETKYITFSYSDADGHKMSPFLETKSKADSICILSSKRAQAVIIGINDKPGTYTSTVSVKDEYDAVSSFQYTFTIYENHAPSKIKEFGNVLLSKSGETVGFPISDYFYDEDGETLTYTTSVDSQNVVSVSSSDGKFYVTGLSAGTANVTITATDALGATASTTFMVVVRASGKDYDVYPNPVKTNMYVRTGATEENASVKVVSSNGGVVYDKTIQASAFNPVVVDMSSCAPGTYKVYISYGGKKYETTVGKI